MLKKIQSQQNGVSGWGEESSEDKGKAVQMAFWIRCPLWML